MSEVFQFCWPLAVVVVVVFVALLVVNVVLFGFDAASYWWHENGVWFILLMSTLICLLIASVKTFTEPSPLNWEVRQEMSNKNSKLNKTASYLWTYLKGENIEKKEDIFLDVEPMKTARPSGPGWFLKALILLWITFFFSFKAWSDEVWVAYKKWQKRKEENKDARSKKEKEPHENAGFFNYFFPAFMADVISNLVEHWKK